ncbi:MAG: hypothetical protein BroJett003_15770 [Planctomycetota bacterium]|nr:MAG: hypothetical protein BroJett003_15770 [Planctomycetota bacterium]
MLCPQCLYDLRGLPGLRCPECGGAHTLEEIHRSRGLVMHPATPWEASPSAMTFLATVRLVLERPQSLACGFPGWHNSDRSFTFSALCYAAAVLPVVTGLVAMVVQSEGLTTDLLRVIFFIPGPMLGFLLCDVLAAAGLSVIARPTCAKSPHHFWSGVVRYGSVFATFSGGLAGSGLLIRSWWLADHRQGGAFLPLLQEAVAIGLALNTIAWLVYVCILIHNASPLVSPMRRGLAYCFMPVAGLAGFVFGGFVSMLSLM